MGRERHARQSFLGPDSERRLAACTVGVVGLGGGGSHVAQQLAHVGVRSFVLRDPQGVEDTNLNRLVGGTASDALLNVPKVHVLGRLILSVAPDASVDARPERWQDASDELRRCDAIVGCVDSFQQRHELEVFARRFLVPYIDIGLDVAVAGDEPPVMYGQAFLSMPGSACLRCAGILTDERLAQEAARYGDAGGRPQVVWSNAVLASTAVGILIDLVTDWTRSRRGPVYLSYDSNRSTVGFHTRSPYVPAACDHFALTDLGTPRLERL